MMYLKAGNSGLFCESLPKEIGSGLEQEKFDE